jgi:hypothetical protein
MFTDDESDGTTLINPDAFSDDETDSSTDGGSDIFSDRSDHDDDIEDEAKVDAGVPGSNVPALCTHTGSATNWFTRSRLAGRSTTWSCAKGWM